ncbi:PYROXD1 [Cordylochernes scorpioides]|uniref:Pyridine nucleotide-disulfide oxidoreductase domain-containing protein 1 n=1 Tax=Cordylochernes scorpioides TaxID=51811 RepID=A0ABY6L3W3_9ARAC|nr:PYROXD1 [Cordylochernes scorpioides]
MKKKEEADKIDLFMYLMGDSADDIFRTFKFEKEEEATKIDSVLKAFDSHFFVRKNIIYERANLRSPTRPWQKIGMDLFKFENKWYLVVIDYYSRFPEMIQLDRLTANVVVRSCKSIFARHGIPETVVSDNGTQFGAAREFSNFARQNRCEKEIKKNQDPSLGLLEYRSTPLENGYSPAELLMGRKLRTTLPIAPENLNPKATDMEELSEGDTVWITDMRIWGIVKKKASTPRSYMVDTPVGTLRRNRFHLRKGDTVQYPADPYTPTFSGEELVENEKTPVVDYPSNDSEDGQIRTRSAKPNLISKHPNIIGLRDMDSISTFQDMLQSAKRFVLIGNGGIAIELVNEISNCEIIWVIKHDAIGNTFFDSVAAKFFTPHLQNKPSKPKTIKYAIKSRTATNELGNALGPDWHLDLILSGKENHSNIILEIQTEVSNIYTHDEFKTHSSNEESNLHQWPVFVELTNGKTYGGDFILSATGVLPNTEVFRANNDFKVSQDGGLLVDEYMRTNLPNVYAAGDACTANWNIEKHWFQMKLWTQARQMGSYAGHCMHADLHNEIIFPDISFELFTHVTSFFGFKVILLGLFNGQKIDNNYEVLMRITENAEYIKVVLQDGKVQGAILVGDTDLEETFENLILSQLNISGLEEDILNPDIDIEDYFD